MTIKTIIGLSFIIIAALLAVSAVSYKIGREQGRAKFIQDAFRDAVAHGYRPPDEGVIRIHMLFEQGDGGNSENESLPPPTGKHRLTHADMVQMETDVKNKEKEDANIKHDA